MNLTTKLKLPPIVWSCLSIGFGVGLTVLVTFTLRKTADLYLSPIEICLAGGGVAAFLGYLVRLPIWWVPLNFSIPVLAYMSLAFSLPGWAYLLCFVLLALVFWNSADERVPLYLSNQTTWVGIEGLCDEKPGTFLDIGCGLGGTLFYLAKAHPERLHVGIESAPLPYLFARTKQIMGRHENVKIIFGDMWKLNFADYQTIYAFLSPEPMARLYDKVSAEIDAGGQLISNSFAVPDIPPEQILSLDDKRQTQLLIWQFQNS